MTQKLQQLQEAIREVCTELKECTRSLMSCGKIPCKNTDHFGKIELQHILRAIGNMMIIMDCFGNVYRMEMKLSDKLPKLGEHLGTYDLTIPLDQQIPEVIDFLHSIICKG